MNNIIDFGVCKGLMEQLSKLYRHNRQNAYKTRERYFQGMRRFCIFLAAEFRLQKLANIAPKHIEAYVLNMQERGLAASTIKTELSSVRFWHDQIPRARHKLPPNSELNLERRTYGGLDRTWSADELERMLNLCRELGREDYVAALSLARYVGMRVHEVHKIDTAIARDAIRKMEITAKGKGGRVRSIPLPECVKVELEKMLAVTKQGHKLFVVVGTPTHIAINRLQRFIDEHRPKVQDANSDRPMSMHGLRHSYAVEQYKELIAKGCSETDACKRVSFLLGHTRPDVTKIYLASLLSDEANKDKGL